LIYKPQRKMKKLERLDSLLFKKLAPNQFTKLSSIIGGGEKASCNDSTGKCDVLHTSSDGKPESRNVSPENKDEWVKDTECNDKGNDKFATSMPVLSNGGLMMTLTASDGDQYVYSLS